jgi:hypothetical protein
MKADMCGDTQGSQNTSRVSVDVPTPLPLPAACDKRMSRVVTSIPA